MKILVCGASGFIGKAICERLRASGHQVIRGVRQPRFPDDMEMDFSRDTTVDTWQERLERVDAVVNAVGIITETSQARFEDIHHRAPAAMFAACARAGVRRVIQISALGAETGDTRYFRSKNAADQILMGLPLEWMILRPSLVYGENGISASMFRTLASMPIIPVPELGGALFQPVHIDDLAKAVALALEPTSPAHQCLELVGATGLSYRDMLDHYRRSMGLASSALWITIPAPIMALAARVSGWVPGMPLTPENWKMLQMGNAGNAAALTHLLGHAPKSIEEFIPADRADDLRRRALGGWTTPMLHYVLAFVWLASAWVSLFAYPVSASLELLARVGITGSSAEITLYGASTLDTLMGLACITHPSRKLWLFQATLIAMYSAIIATALPELLIHPFGPVLKNLPILAILAILLAQEK